MFVRLFFSPHNELFFIFLVLWNENLNFILAKWECSRMKLSLNGKHWAQRGQRPTTSHKRDKATPQRHKHERNGRSHTRSLLHCAALISSRKWDCFHSGRAKRNYWNKSKKQSIIKEKMNKGGWLLGCAFFFRRSQWLRAALNPPKEQTAQPTLRSIAAGAAQRHSNSINQRHLINFISIPINFFNLISLLINWITFTHWFINSFHSFH